MKMKMKKKGSILAFAIILMSFMMVIAIALVTSSLMDRKSADISSNSTTAFQRTDKGIEIFLYELFENSKPYSKLGELAKSMKDDEGNSYECKLDGQLAVIVGSDFKMISYKSVNPDSNNGEALKEVDSCEIEIARISKVKVSGLFGGAVRSIEVNLSNSLQRGRIARWDFEDNTRTMRMYDSAGAAVATDSSKDGDYVLSLCPIEYNVSGENYSPTDLPNNRPSKNCPYMKGIDGSDETPVDGTKNNLDKKGFFMNHNPKWFIEADGDVKNKPDDDGSCLWNRGGDEADKYEIPCGAYVAGIYSDNASGKGQCSSCGGGEPVKYDADPKSDVYYKEEKRTGSEALEFNGFSHYLSANLEDESGKDNFVKEGLRENLNLNGKDGMTISLWVNDNSETGNKDKEILVLKAEGDNDGYELFIKDKKVHFRVNGQEAVSGELSQNSWHHIVARYDGANKGGWSGVLIDGERSGSNFSGAGTITDKADIPLFIGGFYDGDDAEQFEIEKFEGGFGGMIDQVEIFNRYLIDFEVEELCNMASGDDWMQANNKVSGLCKGIEW